MTIGVASPSFCFEPFSEMAELVAGQFDLWEVLVEGKHSVETLRKEASAAMDSYDLRLQVHAPMTDVNIGSMYEPMRQAAVEEVSRTIEACGELGISLLTVHPGFVNGIAFLEKSSIGRQTRRSIEELAPFAEDRGVMLALENMPRGINAICTTAEELVEMIEGTSAGACFDMGHANTAGEVEGMLRHVPLFRNAHLHNNDGTWDQHEAVDQGTADLDHVVAAMRLGGYSGNYIIESTSLDRAVTSKRVLERLLV